MNSDGQLGSLHTAGATGSIPVPSTIRNQALTQTFDNASKSVWLLVWQMEKFSSGGFGWISMDCERLGDFTSAKVDRTPDRSKPRVKGADPIRHAGTKLIEPSPTPRRSQPVGVNTLFQRWHPRFGTDQRQAPRCTPKSGWPPVIRTIDRIRTKPIQGDRPAFS